MQPSLLVREQVDEVMNSLTTGEKIMFMLSWKLVPGSFETQGHKSLEKLEKIFLG